MNATAKVTDETNLGTTGALTYEILNASGSSFSPKKTGTVDLHAGKSDDWSFEIDTTALTETTGTFKVKVTAQDAVGNKTDNASSLIVLNVDQTTDKPVVKLSNANVKVTTEAQISSTAVTSETASANKGNLFGMGNDSIFASASDDDGIATIVLKIDGTEVTKADGSAYFDVGTETPTSYAMEIPLKTLGINGTHNITIEVTDKYASSDLAHKTYSINTDSVSGVYFAYDDDLPVALVEHLAIVLEAQRVRRGLERLERPLAAHLRVAKGHDLKEVLVVHELPEVHMPLVADSDERHAHLAAWRIRPRYGRKAERRP